MSAMKTMPAGTTDATRRKLLEHATRLMTDQGSPPTLAEVATAAKVARQTAYRYFSTAEELAAAAALHHVRGDMDRAEAVARAYDDPDARLEATVRAFVALTFRNEYVLRSLTRVFICEPNPTRVRQRLKLFRTALQPLRATLGQARFSRLLDAVLLAIGFESLLKLKDDRGISASAAADLAVWTARTIVRAAVAETGPASS